LIAIDTNILIYSVSTDEPTLRHFDAIEVMKRIAPAGAIVPLQVIGEFLNVCRRKKIVSTPVAVRRVNEFMHVFDCPATSDSDLLRAFELAAHYQLQYFDALIISVAARAGATILLSEDMQDGLDIDGLHIVNPFSGANEPLLTTYFGSIE
jgi:predicted nucleic acid-binding protein